MACDLECEQLLAVSMEDVADHVHVHTDDSVSDVSFISFIIMYIQMVRQLN